MKQNMSFDSAIDRMLKNYKTGLLVSVIVLASVLFFLAGHYLSTGFVVSQGIDFTGGTQAVIEVDGAVDIELIRQNAEDVVGRTVTVKKLVGTNTITIETTAEMDKETITAIVEKSGLVFVAATTHVIGASLSATFFAQAARAIITAYVLMSIIVFFLFRSFIPSVAIMLAGFADIATTVFGMNVLGINLSMATVAGLLILIGYSIDTDILLSTRVLKRRGEGTVDDRIKSSIKTGMTMSLTSIVAMVVLYAVSSSVVLDEISIVIMMGLAADMFYTWLQNVGILKIYAERKFK